MSRPRSQLRERVQGRARPAGCLQAQLLAHGERQFRATQQREGLDDIENLAICLHADRWSGRAMRGSMGLRHHHCKSAKICQGLPAKKRFSVHFRSMTYREPTSPPTITKVYAIAAGWRHRPVLVTGLQRMLASRWTGRSLRSGNSSAASSWRKMTLHSASSTRSARSLQLCRCGSCQRRCWPMRCPGSAALRCSRHPAASQHAQICRHAQHVQQKIPTWRISISGSTGASERPYPPLQIRALM